MKVDSVEIPTPESALSTVAPTAQIDGWPAGTVGTLVETFPHEGFVEIVDDEGRTRAIVTAPYSSLRLSGTDR
jgi:hypothetical protein